MKSGQAVASLSERRAGDETLGLRRPVPSRSPALGERNQA